MSKDIKDYEIMAPVGSRESLAAAIQAGADSIYFGIEKLNRQSKPCRLHGLVLAVPLLPR